jgi:hypothetical protein
MTQRVKMAKVDPGVVVEIEIPGDKIYDYKAIPVTVDVEEELELLETEVRRVEENRDASPADRVECQLKQLDCILRPAKQPAGDSSGPPEKVSELLMPAYRDKKVTAMVVRQLALDILDRIRPT